MVTTPVSDSVVARRVHKNCAIMFPNRVIHVELVELDTVDFDVILGMDLSHTFFACIDYRKRLDKFNFLNEPVLKWKGGILFLKVISFLV